jgi:hypothetical protein
MMGLMDPRARTGWAGPRDDPGHGQRALADQGGGGAARSCVTIKMLTKYAFGVVGGGGCDATPLAPHTLTYNRKRVMAQLLLSQEAAHR